MREDDLTAPDPASLAGATVQRVVEDMDSAARRGIVVDSPPGAGKTTLVVAAARRLLDAGEQPMIVAQTNAQVDDLALRLAAQDPPPRLGRLSATDYAPPQPIQDLAERGRVAIGRSVADLRGTDIVLGTAAKWGGAREHRWPWAIIDEAYQMRSDMLLPIAALFERALFVGDPGQLDPFSIVETPRWTGLDYDPMDSAVAVVLKNNPELQPPHRLPVSWRLPASAAPVVAEAFYPFTGFQAATAPGTRRLELAQPGVRDAVDATLAAAAESGWALHELPARHTRRTDPEAVAACARIAERLLARGTEAGCERHPGGRPLGAADIAVGAAHRDQADHIRRLLLGSPVPGAERITVDTANRLQGREFAVTVVLHPLSGRRDATAFHLEAGRLCVLTSRHRHACIVVARAGIADLLDAYPSSEPVHLGVSAKFPDGWEANQVILAHLSQHRAGD